MTGKNENLLPKAKKVAVAIAQRRLLAAQCARRRPKAARDIFVSSCGHTL